MEPDVSEYAALADHDWLRTRGLFVAEGRLVVERLIEDGRWPVRSLLLSESAAQGLEPAIARLRSVQPAVPIYVRTLREVRDITGFDIHRGCLGLAERPVPRPLAQVLDGAHTVVVLEAVTNADNVGGVFRNAAAFGANAVILSPNCCDPLYRKAIRTSMAATLRVPFAQAAPWPDRLNDLRLAGFTLTALTPREPATTLDAFCAGERPARIALVIGAEGSGLSADVERLADVRVRIPIRPAVDSLNLSVAAGIALSRLSRAAGL